MPLTGRQIAVRGRGTPAVQEVLELLHRFLVSVRAQRLLHPCQSAVGPLGA
jgi:hypothetical protein